MIQLVTLLLLAVLYGWATASFPVLARRKRWVAAALVPLWLAQVASGWLIGHEGDSSAPRIVVELVLTPLIIGALPLALVLGVSRLSTLVHSKMVPQPCVDRRAATVTRRQVVEATTGIALFGATGSMLGWGMLRGRHEFELREVPVRIVGLPRALDGYVIVQISDIHAGPYVGERELEEGLALVRRARPDLVAVTGDSVDFDAEHARLVARKLADLNVRDGVAAVLGNHEYYADEESVIAIFRAAGHRMLVDDGLLVRGSDGGGFALLGVDDRWSIRYGKQGPRLARAVAMVPAEAPRILLSHQPTTVEEWAGQVALQLSGHTHGGQINPGFSPIHLFYPYVHGLYSVRGTTLYVNRGFGTVATPSRVGAPPEVTRLVLLAA